MVFHRPIGYADVYNGPGRPTYVARSTQISCIVYIDIGHMLRIHTHIMQIPFIHIPIKLNRKKSGKPQKLFGQRNLESIV